MTEEDAYLAKYPYGTNLRRESLSPVVLELLKEICVYESVLVGMSRRSCIIPGRNY